MKRIIIIPGLSLNMMARGVKPPTIVPERVTDLSELGEIFGKEDTEVFSAIKLPGLAQGIKKLTGVNLEGVTPISDLELFSGDVLYVVYNFGETISGEWPEGNSLSVYRCELV